MTELVQPGRHTCILTWDEKPSDLMKIPMLVIPTGSFAYLVESASGPNWERRVFQVVEIPPPPPDLPHWPGIPIIPSP